MNFQITKLQIRILKWIAEKIVIQSHHHQNNIIEYYKILADAAREEFREDNDASLNSFLTECFKKSLK